MTQQKKKVEQTITLNLIIKQLKALPSMQIESLNALVSIDGIQEMDLGQIEIDELMRIYDLIIEGEHRIYAHIECVHKLIKRIRLSKGRWLKSLSAAQSEEKEEKEETGGINALLNRTRTANLGIVSLVAEFKEGVLPAKLVASQPEIELAERQLSLYLKTNKEIVKQCLNLPAIPTKSPPMGF